MTQVLVKDPLAIHLGVIGMTEGNGHPYSWSAIINGYDSERSLISRNAVSKFSGLTLPGYNIFRGSPFL